MDERTELKRDLGLARITIFGIGIILGAGIYVLIGEAASLAGNALLLYFLLAYPVALFTGLSYAELS
jgi:APA family basic amino acid/polyamine antiporter